MRRRPLGLDGSAIVNDPLYNYFQSKVGSTYVIQATPVFSSLQIAIPSLNNFFTSPSSGTLFFNPVPPVTRHQIPTRKTILPRWSIRPRAQVF